MWERVLVIIRKEFRQTFREPRMRVFLFVPPLMQLFMFGFAVNLDLENSPIAFMDRDQTPESRELLSGFQGSRQFNLRAYPETDEAAQNLNIHGMAFVQIARKARQNVDYSLHITMIQQFLCGFIGFRKGP